MQLTRNFRLSEFAVSQDHPDLAAAITFSETEIERLRFACCVFLQPLRDAFGPVTILSGKRTPALNTAVRGSKGSHHLFYADTGAADFTIPGVHPLTIAKWLADNRPGYDRLIVYPTRNFVHLSFPRLISTGKIYDGEEKYSEITL